MTTKEPPPGGGPELDPFGANDPAWERLYGISWLRRIARGGGRTTPRPKGELLSALVVTVLGLAVLVGGVFLVFWLISLLPD
jgi:hypothetical protein